jgi:hypothetical protein
MALKLSVEKIEDIDEAQRGLYVQKDGKFVLDVDGLPDTAALERAKQTAAQEAITERKKRQKWESLGKTPEEIESLIAAQAEAEAKRAREEGDFNALLKQHQDKAAKDREALEAELQAARNSELAILRSERVIGELAKAGATEEGAELLPDRLAKRIKFETVDGARVIKIVQDDGTTPMAGSGPGGVATIADLVKETATKFPALFKGANNGGGGKPPIQGGGGGGVTKKSDFKSEKERAAWTEKNGLEAYKALPA